MTRYAVIASKPGRMDVYAMDEDWRYPLTGDPIYSIVGYLQPLETGYAIELRLPRTMVSGDARLAIAIADVDDAKERTLETVLGTSAANSSTELGKVRISSPEIDEYFMAWTNREHESGLSTRTSMFVHLLAISLQMQTAKQS